MKKSFRLSDVVPNAKQDVDDEVAFHLEMRAREYMEQGLAEPDARRRAEESFGDVAAIRGDLRSGRADRNDARERREWWTGVLSDLRFSLRSLRSNKAFAVAAIATMALGIGANSAIFSIVNSVLLRPLPYAQPDRLVMLWGRYPDYGRTSLSLPDFVDWRAQAQSFEAIAAIHATTFNYLNGDEPIQLRADRITANFFDALGVRPMLGRAFRSDEELGGDDFVVVLGHGFWQRQFASDPDVIGRSILLSGQPHTIVGVAPPGFRFMRDVDLWAPARTDAPNANRRAEYLTSFGRLRPGVTLRQGATEIATIARRLSEQYPATNQNFQSDVVTLHDEVVGNVRPMLLVFAGAVGLVLLIACANVANLLLARAAAREREIAVRSALGASRGRIVRQLLTESLLVGVIGGVLGLVLATWAVLSLRASETSLLPRLGEVHIDGVVVAFALVLSLVTGLVFGLAPALRLSAGRLHDSIKEGARGAAGRAVARFRHALVLAEVALAVVLLVGAGLLIRSFEKLNRVDTGFDARNVLTYQVVFPSSRYPEVDALGSVYDRIISRTKQVPGVQAAAVSNTLPMLGAGYVTFNVENHPFPPRGPNSAPIDVQPMTVSPEFLSVMGLRLVLGRFIEPRDVGGAGYVAVVNTEMVRQFFPQDRDPVGMRVTFGNPNAPDVVWRTVVGVVDVVAQEGVSAKPYSQIYVPIAQAQRRGVFVSIRTAGSPLGLVNGARDALRGVDRELPMNDVATMEQRVSKDIAATRVSVVVLSVFAALALTLAAIGIYGVLAYAVAQRTREIGIRMALGASAGSVRGLIVRQGMMPAIIGLAAGLLGAYFLTELMQKILFGVEHTDPATFVGVAAFLGGVALIASYLPARRATRVAPTEALRYE